MTFVLLLRVRWVTAIFLLSAVAAQAQVPSLESWSDTTLTAWRNQRTELNVNLQERAYPSRLDPYRTRGGPVVEHQLRPGLSLWSGMYFQHLQAGVGDRQTFDNFVRVFSGLTYRLYRKGILQVDGRTVAERFIGVSAGDYSRYRQRVLVNFDKSVAPYVSNEIFWNGTGLLSNRTAVGLRTRFTPEWSMQTGFLWENRSFVHQPERYALVVSVIYRKRAPKS